MLTAHNEMQGKGEKLGVLLTKAKAYATFLAERLQLKKEESNSNDSIRLELFSGILHPFQLEGVKWLLSLWENGLNGILADEMGLGKTVQVLAFLSVLYERGIHGPYLIVVPASTLHQWEAECQRYECIYNDRFLPNIPCELHYGPDRPKRIKLTSGILLTTYEIGMRDISSFKRINWKYLVVDEGHRLKNHSCRLIRELKSLNTENRLLMTGTPLQNNLAELWSLLNFLLPTVFDSLEEFESWFDIPKYLSSYATKEDGECQDDLNQTDNDLNETHTDDDLIKTLIEGLHCVLKPFLLRRYKSQVLKDLVPKTEYTLLIEPSDLQKELFAKVLDGETPLNNRVMQLRKICNHPKLFFETTKNTTKNHSDWNVKDARFTNKLPLLLQLLEKLIKEGHKVLVFSQMTRMLDILEEMLSEEYALYRLDGTTPTEERDDMVKTQADCQVFLLSTRAGGLGLNLSTFDTVIFYDSDWNPQVDKQAMDRVHRIGQTRPVLILRFCLVDSIEWRMRERAMEKLRLGDAVIHRKRFKTDSLLLPEEELTSEDLKAIFSNAKHLKAAKSKAIISLSKRELAQILDRSSLTEIPN